MTGTLLAFAAGLRAAGVAASPDRVQAWFSALDHVGVISRADMHAAGRATLCASWEDVNRFDRAFDTFFARSSVLPVARRTRVSVQRPAAVPTGRTPQRPSQGRHADGDARVATASPLETLRARDIARLGPAERAALNRLLAALAPPAPQRRSRRHRPAGHGGVDPRRILRATLARGGEPALRYRERTNRPRRLVLLIDVSGSMAPYADALLRFAHAAARRRAHTEVFTIGTRLTRITREITTSDPDAALGAVAAAVPDWSGGTRLGELLRAFLDRWGQRGTARGAVVVIASDGWERGDVALLGEQTARLRRLAHRVVWVNPHRGKPGFAPVTAGMAAALPHVDALVEGHTLGALERLAEVLGDA